jgi:hypothetical protein
MKNSSPSITANWRRPWSTLGRHPGQIVADGDYTHHASVAAAVLGKVHTLPQFRDGDNTQSQSLRPECLQAPGYGLDSVEVVNNLIGVNQEGSQRHRRGSGRVVTRRLSLTSCFRAYP